MWVCFVYGEKEEKEAHQGVKVSERSEGSEAFCQHEPIPAMIT